MSARAISFPLARIVRNRGGRWALLPWIVFAIVLAVVSRGRSDGASHVLVGSFARFVMPLLSFSIATAVVGKGSLVEALAPLTTLGASRERAGLTIAFGSMLASAGTSAFLGAMVVIVSHGTSDPPLVTDVVNTLWICALGGAAYGAYFSAASTLFGRFGRSAFLIADFILGGGSAVSSLFVPRAHIRSLLGGAHALTLSQRWSAVALVALTIAFVLLALVRIRTSRK